MQGAQEIDVREAKRMLDFLRAVGTEEQRIAFAVMEGMRLQKNLDSQSEAKHQGQRDRPA